MVYCFFLFILYSLVNSDENVGIGSVKSVIILILRGAAAAYSFIYTMYVA